MVLRRGKFGVFLLTLVVTALCLGLLFTTPSDAQTRAEPQNSRAAVGDEDCLDFGNDTENEAEDETGDQAGADDIDEDAGTVPAEEQGDAGDQLSPRNGDQGDTAGDQALKNGDEDDADQQTQDENSGANRQTQQAQGQNESNLRVQNDNSGVFQQSLLTDQRGGVQQSLQTDDESDALQQSLENGEEEEDDTNGDTDNGTDGDTDGTNSSTDGDTDGQQTQDEDAEEDDECVIAKTVPDEPLLPTGAPAKSGPSGTAKNKSGGEKQKSGQKSGGEKQSKTASDKGPEAGGEKTGGADRDQKQATSAGKRSGGGKKLEIQDRGKKTKVEDRSGKAPRREKSADRPGFARAKDDLPESSRTESPRTESIRATDFAPRLAAAEWASPSGEEVAFTKGPRRFAPDPGAEMTLSSRALRLYNVPIANSNSLEDLDRGLVRSPNTSRPWDEGDQRNVYVAGHYLGLPETQSRMIFYNLDKLKSGDELVLKDSLGQTYKYRVSEKFAAGPEDSWVMGQVRGRDMLTLQTCIPPDFGKRLVVRADRV